jgi:hypothetical protein
MSTLDERIARDCERSGVRFHVTDEAVLERVAALVAETLAEMVTEGRADWIKQGGDHARPA